MGPTRSRRPPPARTAPLAALAVVLPVVLAGCGGDDAGTGGGDTPTTGPTAASASPSASAPASPVADSDGESSPPAGGAPSGPPTGGDGWPADPCGTGEFATGSWGEPGGGGTATDIAGLAVDGHADCVRLRITFDGPAPGFSVQRQLSDNQTVITFDRGNAPTTPLPGEDVVQPGFDLLSGALVGWRDPRMRVHVVHGPNDVAVRPTTDGDRITLYFRTAQPDDTARGRPLPGADFSFGGAPTGGIVLIDTGTLVASDDVVFAHGYAKTAEAEVRLQVHEPDGGPLACEQRGETDAARAHLFTWFQVNCGVDEAGPHQAQVTAGDARAEYVVAVG